MNRNFTKPNISCYDKALDLLARRAHSRAELERKLLEHGCPKEETNRTLERLTAARLIDDQAYAEHQTERMMKGKGFAPRRIAQELRRRGVDAEAIETTLEAMEDYDPRAAVSALIERKFARDLDTEKGRRRVVNALIRMGYDWQNIRAAMREYEDTEEI
ncbi:MAG: recombination regulator RecX [Oscillospiraceae bacterium]|jgi:regulatory protein|nr:recombination regulator RecX [Oscillospiraceae bacterium]